MRIYESRVDVNEIYVQRGHYDTNPLQDFFVMVANNFNFKERQKILKKFYSEKVNLDVRDISDREFEMFFEYIQGQGWERRNWMKKFSNYDYLSGLAYEFAKKSKEMKSGGFGLEYIVADYEYSMGKNFWFFDKAFKLFIGKVGASKSKIKEKGGHTSDKVWQIDSSAAERKLIGMGYGLKMYFTILDNCDYLKSDTVLFSGSFRIWSKVLPKYSNVWALVDEDNSWIETNYPKFIKIEGDLNLWSKANEIEYFIASTKHKKI